MITSLAMSAALFAAGPSPSPSPTLAAGPPIESSCSGSVDGEIVVINLPGFDFRTWGWLRLSAPAGVTICNYKVYSDWGDAEVAAIQGDLEVLLRQGKTVVFASYSMTAPMVAEILDTSRFIRYQPHMLANISALMVAPAIEVTPFLRPSVKHRAERWNHAWRVHFEQNIIAQRNHLPEWNEFIDRLVVLQAGRELVVKNDALSPRLRQRLGDNIRMVPKISHVKMRNNAVVNEHLVDLLEGSTPQMERPPAS